MFFLGGGVVQPAREREPSLTRVLHMTGHAPTERKGEKDLFYMLPDYPFLCTQQSLTTVLDMIGMSVTEGPLSTKHIWLTGMLISDRGTVNIL